MRISDWSSDVCSSDLVDLAPRRGHQRSADLAQLDRGRLQQAELPEEILLHRRARVHDHVHGADVAGVHEDFRHRQPPVHRMERSEEHTSELQSLMRISYAVFCMKKKNI